ncbi:MAG: Uncharacterized protein FD147_2081 [Chloroflexi bacterium]|nr:MAG: Uncharacterized protein FD147_2081 [Chloroflexota bacterium]
MKKILVLVLISFMLVSCSLPFSINWNTPAPQTVPQGTAVQVETPTLEVEAPTLAAPTIQVFTGTEMNLGGVYMVLPPCLAANAAGTLIPAQPYDPAGGPMEYWPQHRSIAYPGYPLAGKFFEPELRVYPVAEFMAMNPNVVERVSGMQTLLTSQPATPDQAIPFLPVYAAAQVFRAQVKYMNFQNGQGARFLTEYAQYYAPVNNHDLFYTYQGLTADGKYWVSATFPINAAYLQENADAIAPAGGVPAPLMTSPNYEAEMLAYFPIMINMLNATADNAFTPGLDCLDQYIQSLNISD